MDILSVGSANVLQGTSMAMLKNNLEQVQQTGEQLVEMAKDAAIPNGSTIDVSI